MMSLNTPEPAPVANDAPATWPRVRNDAHARYFRVTDREAVKGLLSDMLERHLEGIRKYGTPLQPGNGRDSLKDAYQEVLDLCVYLKNAQLEGPAGNIEVVDLYEDALDLALAVRVRIGLRGEG